MQAVQRTVNLHATPAMVYLILQYKYSYLYQERPTGSPSSPSSCIPSLSEACLPSIRAVPIMKYRSSLCRFETLYQLDFSFAFTRSPFTQTLCCILELKQDPDPEISQSLNGGVILFSLLLFFWPAREKGDFYVSLWRDIRSALEVEPLESAVSALRKPTVVCSNQIVKTIRQLLSLTYAQSFPVLTAELVPRFFVAVRLLRISCRAPRLKDTLVLRQCKAQLLAR